MSNSIKYSTNPETLALKTGDFWIGTGDVPKGPTSTTGYWNGITPPSNGYTIYLNKTTGGPSMYIANNDSELITITNQIANTSFTTVQQCFTYYSTQNDKMVFNQDYPPIVTDGLVLNLDAGFRPSYPTSGTTWFDLSGNNNNGTLVNGPTFDSGNNGSFVFDGVNDFIDLGVNNNLTLNNGGTISIFFKWSSYNGTSWSNTLIGRGGSSWINHHYILFKHSDTNRLHLSVSNGVNAMASNGPRSTFDIELNKIYNVTITIDNPLKKMYINGVFNTQASSTIMPISTPTTVSLGRTGNSIYYLNGNIYNVLIYNRILSDEEITQNYNATKGRFGL